MKTKLLLLLLLANFSIYAQTNLVQNGNLEIWTNSTTPENWTTTNSVSRNWSSVKPGDEYSAQLSLTDAALPPKITAQVPLKAGITYTIKFNYRYASTNFSGDHPIALNISQNGSATTLSSSTFATNNLGSKKEATFTPDQDLSYDLSISTFSFDGQPFDVTIDNVQVYVQGTEPVTLIPDANFEKKLIALGIDSGEVDGKVVTPNISDLTNLDLESSSISDLTGIQDFKALKSLAVYSNNLTNIDLSKNTELITLNIMYNKLVDLNLSANTKLENLFYDHNTITAIDLSKNTALQQLSCGSNGITSLNISSNINLTYLSCSNNKLTSLDVSQNTSLLTLSCYTNEITALDVSTNLVLQNLDCETNKLQKLDVTKNTQLHNLTCSENSSLTEIDLSGNPNLNTLNCSRNYGLTTLDVSKNTKLLTLRCSENKLESLDLSKNVTLSSLTLNDNRVMSTLNLQNGKNSLLTTINIKNNSSLYCVLVDDVDYSNTNWAAFKDSDVNYTLSCSTPEYTLVPDIEFERQLMYNRLDGVLDGKILTSKANAKESLSIDATAITDLTGLEAFKSLKTFECRGSGNAPKLSKLDISPLTHLTSLNCSFNKISTLDTSNNLELTELVVNRNLITSLDVSKNLALTNLSFDENSLKEINVSINTALTSLSFTNNAITTLDLTNNTALQYLYADRNNLKILDLSKNLQLLHLNSDMNDLRTLDVSKNTKLENISTAYNNKLVYLNLKNGNNKNFKTNAWDYKGFTNTSNLTCIEVDDIEYSNSNWAALKDAKANYSNSCPVVLAYTAISDSNFEKKLIALQIDTDGENGKVLTSNIVNITSLDLSNSQIQNLSGIQDFVSLQTLNCSKNLLSELYINNNTLLTDVNCSFNNILDFNVSQNIALKKLSVSYNKLTGLDVSKNTNLKEFDCAGNNLYTLNLKNGNNANMQNMIFGNFTENPNLLCIQVDDAVFSTDKWIAKDAKASYSSVACPENIQYTLIPDANFENILIANGIDTDGPNGKVLTSSIRYVKEVYALDLTNKITDLTGIEDFSSLEELHCYHGAITKLDVSKNLKLRLLEMDDNNVTALDLSKNTALTYLDCGSNKLTELNISNNKALKTLIVDNNLLTAIDVSQNLALESLGAGSNQITNIDVTANLALKELSVYSNKITTLNTSKNVDLTSLSAFSNELTAIDVSQNKALAYLNAKKCQLTSLNVSNNILLIGLEVNENKIGAIDVSQNPRLTSLLVNSNQLTSLNLKNGKNTLLNGSYVSFSSNPKLYCIQVDDVDYATTNWPYKKDAIATYNTECTGELTLPANNFTVETKGESCTGENNGEISITGKKSFAYNATINDKDYTFTDNALKVASLAPGIYKIKITIPEIIFEQNFTVTIVKGLTITGKSSVSSKKVNVEITEGTAPYTIYVNGTEQFQTTDSNFSLDLSSAGLLEVATAKACEGVFSKKIATSDLVGTLAAYPNPTAGSFEIEIPTSKNEVKIELYNFGGQLISAKTYLIENGKAQLNLENQASGIYAAKIYLETPEYIKIIKK